MKNPSLYLSYSHEVARWVDQFASELRAAKFDVHRASEMPSSHQWESWLRSTIADSDAVIAVLSDEATQSPWLLFEMGAADACGKQIIPVVLGKSTPQLPLIRTRKPLKGSSPAETARRLAADFAIPELSRA